MKILREPFPKMKNTYDLDLYVSTVLNLHEDLPLPEVLDNYSEFADQIQGKHPDLADWLRKAEKIWEELEK